MEGKSGQFTDKNGRRYCLADGKRVACPKQGEAAKKREPAKKPTVDEMAAHIAELKKGQITHEHLQGVAEKLGSMTVKELGQLKAKLGVKASGAKAELVAKIKERALKARPHEAPKRKAPAKKPAAAAAKAKKSPAKAPATDPMAGHHFAGKSREEMVQELTRAGTAHKGGGGLNPWGLKAEDRAGVVPDIVQAVREARAKNSFDRPNFRRIYEGLREKHPGLTLRDFQDALYTGRQSGQLLLDPHTQAKGSVKDVEDLRQMFPLDHEVKFYADLGPKADEARKAPAADHAARLAKGGRNA